LVRAEPGRAEDALEQISSIARDALDEVRGLLAWLRATEDPGNAPGGEVLDALDTQPPSIPGGLTAMVEAFRRAGLPVDLVTVGQIAPPDRELHAIVYRLVQESLANVLRHVGLPGTLVEIGYAEDAVQVRITDDGGCHEGARQDLAADGAGLGLRGLRERVESRGGYFHAGPAPGDGFRVQAVLPVKAGSACPSAS
jgi:signal transduction histidine kinase